MQITVDRGTCEGLGMCESMAHEYFEVDDDDLLVIHDENPPEEDRKLVLAAVNSCPVLALKLTG
jgi:ferredoxin